MSKETWYGSVWWVGRTAPYPKGFDPKKGSIGGNVAKCLACGHTYTNQEMRAMFNAWEGVANR